MAIKKSAKKANRRSEKLRKINSYFKKDMKISIKFLKKSINSEKGDDINNLLKKAYSTIDKAKKRNIIHKNNAARKKSKLAKLVNIKSS